MNFSVRYFSAVSAVVTLVSFVSMAVGEEQRVDPFGLSVTIGVLQTDNRDSIPDGYVVKDLPVEKESDTRLAITPTMSFTYAKPNRYRFYLGYSPSYTWYTNPRDGGEDSVFNHAIRSDLDLFLGARTDLSFSDNYWWSGAKDWNYGPDYEYDPTDDKTRNDDYYQNNFRADLNRLISADYSLRFYGQSRIKRYKDDEVSSYSDEDEYVLGSSLMRRQGRRFSYGVFTEYTAFDRNNPESGEADPTSTSGTPDVIDVGVQYLTSGLQFSYDLFGDRNIVLNARSGYNIMWYEADDLEDEKTIGDSQVDLAIFQQERTGGKVGLRYGKEYAQVYPYSSQKNMTLFASVFRTLGRRNNLRIGVDTEYRTRSYKLADMDPDAEEYGYYLQRLEEIGNDGDAKRDSIYVRANASYRLTSSLSTSVFYSYEDVNSDVDSSYTENTIGLNATYKFL